MRVLRLYYASVLVTTLLACSDESGQANRERASSPAPIAESQTKQASSQSKSCLRLVNGLPTAEFPSVVRLIGLKSNSLSVCTGTFISPTAVITAAHCMDDSPNGGMYLVPGERIDFSRNPLSGATKATRALTLGIPGSTDASSDFDMVAKDTAIVIFPTGLTNSFSAIAASKPSVGTKVLSIGYGLTRYYDDVDPQANFDASKHFGSLDVVAGSDNENIFVGDYTPAESALSGGAKVVNSMGDSGGPIMMNNTIVGTLSVGGAHDRDVDGAKAYFSVFVDINSDNTRALINLANKAGAGIPAPGTSPLTIAKTDGGNSTECQ